MRTSTRITMAFWTVAITSALVGAEVVTIDVDTTVDADHSFPDRSLNVVDGAAPPTIVSVVAGGLVSTEAGDDVNVRGSSILRVVGGRIGATVNSRDVSRVEVAEGQIAPSNGRPAVVVHDLGSLEISGGRIGVVLDDPRESEIASVIAWDTTTMHVSGGDIEGDGLPPVLARGSSQVTVAGGRIEGSDAEGVVAADSSTVTVMGGNVNANIGTALLAKDFSTVQVMGGRIRGFEGEGLVVQHSSTATISDGEVSGDEQWPGISVSDSGLVNILGGRISGGSDAPTVLVAGSAMVNLYAGRIESGSGISITARDSSTVNVFGFGLEIDDDLLTGALADGRSIRHTVQTEDQAQFVLHEVPHLRAGDADGDLDFDQLDVVQVLQARKYLTGDPATWGEGDWNGAPGGAPGFPPSGDGIFNQTDLIAALRSGLYRTGPYAVNPLEGIGVRGGTVLLISTPVPEPSAMALLGLAVGILCARGLYVNRGPRRGQASR